MSNSIPDQVTIAILNRPRGNRGELTATSLSSRPERFSELTTVTLNGGDAGLDNKPFTLEKVWDHSGTLVFKFLGIDSISDADKLRGAEILIPKSDRFEPEPDEFFHSDLIGCEVRDQASNRLVGLVTGWEEYGGPALLEVDNGRLLIPFVKAICTDIRPQDRLIRVSLPDGLEAVNEVPPSNHIS